MLDAALQPLRPLPFEEAIDFWASRLPMARARLGELAEDARARAFTVAGLAKQELLNDVFTALYRGVATGTSFSTFQRDLRHVLAAKGWKANGFRLATIFRTNVLSAYSVGKHKQYEEAGDAVAYLMYDAVGDSRTRPAHQALDGKVFRKHDPIWDTWFPPNGFNCRCTTRGMSAAEVKARGLEVEGDSRAVLDSPVEIGPGQFARLIPDPGFAGNPGKDFLAGIAAHAQDKGAPARLPGLSGPEKYGLPAMSDLPDDALAPPPDLLPRGLTREAYEQHFRRIMGFKGEESAVARTDVMGDPAVVPAWLARKILASGLERGAFIPVLPKVLTEAQEVWVLPYQVGDRIRLRKHLVYAWRGSAGSASGAVVVAELEGGVWREISMSPLNDRTIEQKRRGVLVWRGR